MVEIEREQDPEVLRQVALMLDKEVQRIGQRVVDLTLELTHLKGTDEQLALESVKKFLEADLKRRAEAQSAPEADSPSSPGNQGDGDERPVQSGHGPNPQLNLPIEDRFFEIPVEERICKKCNLVMDEIKGQTEDTEVITVIRRVFLKIVSRCQKYRCRCNANVVTAPIVGRRKLIPGGRYSPEFAIEVCVDKYLDHNPLERQARAMAREGLVVTSQTLFDQMHAVVDHLQPCFDELYRRILLAPVVHADETGWRLWDGKSKSPWCVWGLTTPEIALYQILSSKSKKAAQKVFKSYAGIVIADGYKVYSSLARAGPFRLANCWAHVLRKFRDIEQDFPQACSEILGMIGDLYKIERLVSGAFPGDEMAQRLRLELRRERSKPILDRIREWAFAQAGLPRSRFGKAVRYMLARWEELTLFIEEPRVPLDNNPAERALRGPVVGRKNHYGSRSERGTRVAAVLYTLCETAKLQGVDAKAYLTQALYRAIDIPGTVTLPEDLLI